MNFCSKYIFALNFIICQSSVDLKSEPYSRNQLFDFCLILSFKFNNFPLLLLEQMYFSESK